MLKKIVIIGPESTGKSTLCEQLSQHYHTLWCPEYAREYLLENGSTYKYEDLLKIAKGQVTLEDFYIQKAEDNCRQLIAGTAVNGCMLFIDTDMYVMKVWSEFAFDKCHRYILNQVIERKYDLYLLCGTDLPWIKDELREYPELETRQKLYSIYKDIMINQPVPWVEIRGDYHQRLRTAIDAVNKFL